MNLSNCLKKINSSFEILDVTFRIYGLGYDRPLERLPMAILKRGVDNVILARWIIASRYHVPISRLEELERLKVTSMILEEL
jgi:hypothetical protein